MHLHAEYRFGGNMTGRPALLFLDLWGPPAEQYRATEAAHRQGYDVVLLAKTVPEGLKPYLIDSVETDTYRHETAVAAALALAEQHDFHGCARWLDRSVVLGAEICEALDLPGPRPPEAYKARNKAAMKRAVSGIKGLLPEWIEISPGMSASDVPGDFPYPAILKPAGASGSRGIFRIHSKDELEKALGQARALAQPGKDSIFSFYEGHFLLESFAPGELISVEGFVSGGDPFFAGIIDHKNTEDYFLDYRHVFPAELPTDIERRIYEVCVQILRTVGIDDCAFQIELLLSGHEVTFVEMCARMAGDFNSTHLIPGATGRDHLGNYIRVITGQRPDCPLRPDRSKYRTMGTQYIIAPRQGRLEAVHGIEQAANVHGFEHFFLETAIGADVAPPPDGLLHSRIGSIHASGTSADDVKNKLARIDRLIEPVITDPA